MLVLARRVDERVYIQVPGLGRIVVVITRKKGDSVWLGFEAPRSVRVDRAEVAARRQKEVA